MAPLTKAERKQAQAAEDSFHRTYALQYGEERWQQTLYPALAAPTRYAVLVNRYATPSIAGVFNEGEVERLQSVPLPSHQPSADILHSDGLASYQWNTTEDEVPFPPPKSNPATGFMSHWNLDAASLLAVTMLGPQPGDKVLDLCAAPGGKSVAISQLLRPKDFDDTSPSLAGGCLHSNEVNAARHKRLASNLRAYLPEPLFQSGEVKVLKLDGTEASAVQNLPLGPGGYDKVLLDAPCSSERHVIHAHAKARQGGGRVADEGMASWRSGHSRKVAKTQAALLMAAFRAVRVGGSVLYATCSLSGEENDAVVEKGFELVRKERRKLGVRWDVAVRSRSGSLAAGTDTDTTTAQGLGLGLGLGLDQWAEPTKHGWVVLPDHPGGGRWGPLFFALLEKVAT